ncbi:type III secretion system inner membrane ring subunit SctD [Candidatus Chlamydia corallus]|uniref:type III secretion system inner membrane ring subunit SctD n=1 Tax=Candidatus Chlamydia corallus TaxID=2038470 RepID=UPI000C2FA4F1|nr:type III secretion system inner membrane ring subunit SctD [Candidatus Chlamydia corallus]
MAVRLIVDEGPLSGVIFVLEDGVSWSIGRDSSANDIPVEDSRLALSQALINKTDESYYITNLDDTIPIFVNDVEIQETTQLENEDTIRLGSNQYSFLLDEFDPQDLVYDFDLSEENFSNASEDLSDSNKQVKVTESRQASQTDSSAKAKEKPADQRSGDPITSKDQELADAFLASAKGKKSQQKGRIAKGDFQESSQESSSPKAQNANDSPKGEEGTNEPQNAIMEDNGASPSQDPQPKSAEPSLKKASTDTTPLKEKEPVKEEKIERKEKPASREKKDELEIEERQKNSDEVTAGDSQKDEEDKEAEEAFLQEEEVAEGAEDSDTANDKNEPAAQDGQEGAKKVENEKSSVLSPFHVQDLFRFDQTIFPAEIDDIAKKNISVDLTQPPRFLLKVLAGANIGAEFHLDSGKSYILGTDPTTCDIVFNDLSVSHQHAKIVVGNDGGIIIEDLDSKNGVIVEGRKIDKTSTLSSNQAVALGTTLFLLIDHHAPADTIVASLSPEDYSLFGRQQDAEALERQEAQEEEEKQKRATLPTGSFILTLFIGGLAILFGIGTASLFHTKEVVPLENVDYQEDLAQVINQFSTVRYTFNKTNSQLFLIGHVKNSADKSELLYKVDALSFVKSIDDNVIDDEAVWQEMNILLSKRPEFKGISMHSPEPGKFVITGYVKTEEQAACLVDYLNIHFNYLSLLENKVVVETQMLKAIAGHLLQGGFANIHVAFVNGEVILTGYVNNDDAEKFRAVVQELSSIPGVRLVKNFAVLLPAEEGIIDLNLRYPNRYRVTGYSRYGEISINVVVNGRILTRGDVIDGMTVTSIQPNAIFLEKEGLKYKIDYNK